MPTDRLRFLASRFARSLWFRPTLYAVAAMLALAAGPLFSRFVPESYVTLLVEDATERLLSILASSMLAVAIFSLGTMVQAFQAAAAAATPRARPLLTEDVLAQNAVATFIGAFLFSIMGLIGLWLGLFDKGGKLLLFALGVALVVGVVVVFIRWLDQLAHIGGVGEMIGRVETSAGRAFAAAAQAPRLGGREAAPVPPTAHAVRAQAFGYILHVDVQALSTLADGAARAAERRANARADATNRADLVVHVVVLAGSRVEPDTPLVYLDGEVDDAARQSARAAFTIGRQRQFDVDPGYGLVVLGEIGARALSPAVNDPGTALDVLDAATRLLDAWRRDAARTDVAVVRPRLHVPVLDAHALLEDAFGQIARDGAGDIGVGLRLQTCLGTLGRLHPEAFGVATRRLGDQALALACDRLPPGDRARLEDWARTAFAHLE